MPRIHIPSEPEIPADSKPMLDAIAQQHGFVPNIFRVVSLSPAALSGITALRSALDSALDSRLRDQIGIAVSEVNGSRYCSASNAYFGAKANHLSVAEIELCRTGHASDRKADAALCFAASVAKSRGNVTDAELAAVRAAGFDDREIVEIVAIAVYHLFTNFVTNVCATELDVEFTDDEAMRHGP